MAKDERERQRAEALRLARCCEALASWPAEMPITREDVRLLAPRKVVK